MKYVKMSKSKGNCISPDEVVHKVYQLDSNYEFRNSDGVVIDWDAMDVWRNGPDYFTSSRTGCRPVFLHQKGVPVPCLFKITNKYIVQHANLTDYWLQIVQLYVLEDYWELAS